MKRPGLAMMALFCCWAGMALYAQEAPLHPDSGVVNGRRYINGYFGFSYRFPEGWNGNASVHSGAQEASAARFFGLFTANPMNGGGGNELRYISIQADDLSHNPGVRNGHDFLAVSLIGLTGTQGSFIAMRQQRASYGGKQFYRQDLKSKDSPGAPTFYQTQLVTVERNFALTFSFIAGNTDDLEELVRSAESLNFFEPGSVPLSASSEVAEASKAAVPASPASAPAYTSTTEAMTEQPHESVMVVSVGRSKKSQPPPHAQPESVAANDVKASTDAAAKPAIVTATARVEAKPQAADPMAMPVPPTSATSVAPKPAAAQPKPSPIVAAKVEAATAGKPDPVVVSSSAQAPAAPSPSSTTATPPPPAKTTSTAGLTQPLYGSGIRSASVAAEIQSQQQSKPPSVVAGGTANAMMASAVYQPKPVPVRTAEAAPISPRAVAEAPYVPVVPVATSSANNGRIRISSVTFESYISHKSPVAYPALAKASRIQGEVILRVVIGPDGNLHEVAPVGGPLMLRQGAVEGVKQWRFRPYVVDGQATEVESQVSLNFRLSQ